MFVFPSHTDPWGLVVNEAMACGLPVISSDAAGCTADLVEDNWNGRVVRRGDVAQLASAMEELGQRSGAACADGKSQPGAYPEIFTGGLCRWYCRSGAIPKCWL